jgi:hypothetical protein
VGLCGEIDFEQVEQSCAAAVVDVAQIAQRAL